MPEINLNIRYTDIKLGTTYSFESKFLSSRMNFHNTMSNTKEVAGWSALVLLFVVIGLALTVLKIAMIIFSAYWIYLWAANGDVPTIFQFVVIILTVLMLFLPSSSSND